MKLLLQLFSKRYAATVAALCIVLSMPTWAAYTVNGDGTVTDSETGLVWDRCSLGLSGGGCATGSASAFTWAQALAEVSTRNASNYLGFNDWRLPNVKELGSLVVFTVVSPSIDVSAFPNISGYYFWSATTYLRSPSLAWQFDFGFGTGGAADVDSKANPRLVRLVRSGQPFAAFDGFSVASTTYTVTPSAGVNGTISPSTAQMVNSGSTTSFTATPNSGFTASWGGTCGGTASGNSYTTNAVTANCSVTVSFTANPVNGQCGIAAGVATATAPIAANLCAAGTPSAVVTNASNYTWMCSGVNGGATSSCSAPKTATATITILRSDDPTKTSTSAHGDGHLGARMDSFVTATQKLTLACSATACPWEALFDVSWIRLVGATTGTSTNASGVGTGNFLEFAVEPWEGTTVTRTGSIIINDGTDTPKRWTVVQLPLTDWDEDGVADEWEQRGYPQANGTRASLAGYQYDSSGTKTPNVYPPYGKIPSANPTSSAEKQLARGMRDLWIWIDEMDGLTSSQELKESTLQTASRNFNAMGLTTNWIRSNSVAGGSYKLPVSTPNLNPSTLNELRTATGSLKQVGFQNSTTKAFQNVVYRYVVWGGKFTDVNESSDKKCSAGPSLTRSTGISWSEVNMVFIAAGSCPFSLLETRQTFGLNTESKQVGTLMHELGHAFGLGHGGPWYETYQKAANADESWSDATYTAVAGEKTQTIDNRVANFNRTHKPNHVSIMNYAYQLTGGLITSPAAGNTKYSFGDSSWDSVQETCLKGFGFGACDSPSRRDYWSMPLSIGGVQDTRYGIRLWCSKYTARPTQQIVVGVRGGDFGNVVMGTSFAPGAAVSCDGDQDAKADLDGDQWFETHVTKSDQEHLWLHLPPGFFGSQLGIGVAAANGDAEAWFQRSKAHKTSEPTAEELQPLLPYSLGIRYSSETTGRDIRAIPGQAMNLVAGIENNGTKPDSYSAKLEVISGNLPPGALGSISNQSLLAQTTKWVEGSVVIPANAVIGDEYIVTLRVTSAAEPWLDDAIEWRITVVGTQTQTTPTQIAPIEDRIANDFALTGVTNVKPDIYVESGSVVLTGFDVPLPIQVRGGEMSINGGGWTHYISTVNPGDTLRLRTVSSTVAGEKRTVEVAVGGLVRAFEVTTSLDTDGDGVPDVVESAGPNNGDANGDGIPDKDQKNVGTIFSPAGIGYVTFEVSGGCSVAEAISAYTESQIAVQDTSWAYPLGLVSFRLPCSAATVKLYYHGVSSLTGYTLRRYGPTTPGNPTTSAWTTVPNATFGTATVGASTVATASYGLSDGQPGDDTGTDGVIVDPVGPALYVGGPVDANGNPIPVPTNDRSGLIMLAMMLLLAGGLSYRRHRKRIA